jgi:hypothetical protein
MNMYLACIPLYTPNRISMKVKLLCTLFALFTFNSVSASDSSIDFAISGLDVPIQNPNNGAQLISMVFLRPI